MIQAYFLKNIKRYDQMKNKLKSVKAQPVRPVSRLSERDRVFLSRLDTCYGAVKERSRRRRDKGRRKIEDSSSSFNVICLELR